MAYARITRTWADESACEMEVGCDESYPQSVAEVVAGVVRIDRTACGDEADAVTDWTLTIGDDAEASE